MVVLAECIYKLQRFFFKLIYLDFYIVDKLMGLLKHYDGGDYEISIGEISRYQCGGDFTKNIVYREILR